MKILNKYEKGFIEASIDTDGCIIVSQKKKDGWVSVRLVFYNNSIAFLDKVQEILGSYKNYIKKSNTYNNNLNYELRYYSNDCRQILPQIKLIIKEKKRLKAIEILNELKHGTNQHTITESHKEKRDLLVKEWKTL